MIIQTNMTQEEKAKAYDGALERARKIHSKIVNNELLGFPRQIEDIFPELRKEEKPLTLFQQCLNCILRGVYYAEVPDEKVNEFILNVVRTRTDELIKLAKRHEYTDCQLRESEDERIRKGLIEALKASKTVGELKFVLPYPTREECIAYLEKQKEQKLPDVNLEKEVEKYLLDNADFVTKSTSKEMVNTLARHFYELGRNQVLQELYKGKIKPFDKIAAAWLDDE